MFKFKKTKKDFESWYEDYESGKERDYVYELSTIITAGHKLTKKDCEKFWSLFRIAQKDAFESGE